LWDRQAAADDARRADHVLDCERRGQVLRDYSGDVCRGVSGADAVNIMHLQTPESAILSAVIFNALIIVALIPLALRGVQLHADVGGGAAAAESVDLWLGGSGIPFIGIKLIDMMIESKRTAD
jgi:high-affinity K+ transport system ATPase subunit B